jgi:hypothetical protein
MLFIKMHLFTKLMNYWRFDRHIRFSKDRWCGVELYYQWHRIGNDCDYGWPTEHARNALSILNLKQNYLI